MIADIFGEQGLIVLGGRGGGALRRGPDPQTGPLLGSAQKEFKRGRKEGVAAIGAPDTPDELG